MTKLYLGYVAPENPEQVTVALVAPDGVRNAWDLPVVAVGGRVVPLTTTPTDDDVLVRVPEKRRDEEANE